MLQAEWRSFGASEHVRYPQHLRGRIGHLGRAQLLKLWRAAGSLVVGDRHRIVAEAKNGDKVVSGND